MIDSVRSRNRALVRFIALPMIFLTVALLGGLRVSAEDRAFIFVPPPLITLVLAVLLMLLFVRGLLIDLKSWLQSDNPPLVNISHALTLGACFFASAQAFNSVLPERGLLFWLFSFFFLWTLWNNQFAVFDAKRLLRSLGVLFGTAFVLKHMLIAGLYAPEGGWLKRLIGAIFEGVSLGTLDTQAFAPATGYISFFTLALYIAGLILLPPVPEGTADQATTELLASYQRLSLRERTRLREKIMRDQIEPMDESAETGLETASAESVSDLPERSSEETTIARKLT
jgi:hypothetical protein